MVMQLGFVSAVLGELSLQEVLAFAADEGFDAVELMCWPPGGADRRYAGVCHLDAGRCCESEADVHLTRDLLRIHGVGISGLGYYPNPLDADPKHRDRVVGHLLKVIDAAALLGVGVVNTFVGRDQHKSAAANWPGLRQVWPAVLARAEAAGVTIGVENCPMLFTDDEWPGGRNLASTPAAWRQLFAEFPSPRLGLNLDPSHLIWQHIDVVRCVREFGPRVVHVHAKDTRIDADKLYDHGVTGLGWHTPKLPGLGSVDWGAFFGALTDAGYTGPVCVEVEDRAFEGSLADRKRALRQCRRFLGQWV